MSIFSKTLTTLAAAALALTLTACGGSAAAPSSQPPSSASLTTVKVGASPVPHARILEFVKQNLAQAAGILSFKTEGKKPTQNDVFYFAGIDDARFKRPIMPGDQLNLHVEIERQMRGVWKFKGEARVDGQLAAEARLMCAKRDL